MEIPQTQMLVSRLGEDYDIIPDVIPDERKPLEPPWIVEYEDEDFEDDYDDYEEKYQN